MYFHDPAGGAAEPWFVKNEYWKKQDMACDPAGGTAGPWFAKDKYFVSSVNIMIPVIIIIQRIQCLLFAVLLRR